MDGGCIQQNCPQGAVNELRDAVTAAHAYAEASLDQNKVDAITAKLEEVEDWLVNDSTASSGAVDAISTFASELNALCA